MIVIDAGNTRIKWAQADELGKLGAIRAASHVAIEQSDLKHLLKDANRVIVANVAGDVVAEKIKGMMKQEVKPQFLIPLAEACNVMNGYDQKNQLGIDRWAAVIAAWHMQQQPCIVINAGTAITIDVLAQDKASKKGAYLGGSILPGLQLMYEALSDRTANLSPDSTGVVEVFPKNTQDAIHTGCMDAVVGAVVLKMKQLEKYSAFLPKIVVSGGDAVKIEHALSPHLSRVVMIENIVLEGILLLGKEIV